MQCKHKIGSNPFMTAQKFIDDNELDQYFLDDVVSNGFGRVFPFRRGVEATRVSNQVVELAATSWKLSSFNVRL
jgi:hypothetical protein